MEEKIIESILATANNTANAIVNSAKSENEKLVAALGVELKANEEAAVLKAEKDAQTLIERRVSLANLNKNRLMLSARQKVIKSVYDKVYSKVLNMTDNIYRDFIASIIKKYAENNDRVVVCERDQKRITIDFIKKLAQEMNIKLGMDSDFHPGKGGIILSGTKYDKNITLETMLESLREETEVKVVQKLFN